MKRHGKIRLVLFFSLSLSACSTEKSEPLFRKIAAFQVPGTGEKDLRAMASRRGVSLGKKSNGRWAFFEADSNRFFCKGDAQITTGINNGADFISAAIPLVPRDGTMIKEAPAFADAAEDASELFFEKNGFHGKVEPSGESCVVSSETFYGIVWPFHISAGPLSVNALIGDGYTSFSAAAITEKSYGLMKGDHYSEPELNNPEEAQEFPISEDELIPHLNLADTSKIRSYDRTKIDGSSNALRTVFELTGDGTLMGKRISVAYDPSLGKKNDATSSTGIFDFGENSMAYSNAALYKNAEETARYMDSVGLGWDLMRYVKVYSYYSKDKNNAFYLPSQPFPSIWVGEGDGVALMNLMTDADVVGHELGHHVVYSYLQDFENDETITLHEGLSDFLVFARRNDPCLAASVCPKNAVYCVQPGDGRICLRTPQKQLTWDDASLVARDHPPHETGMIFSGMAWQFITDDKFSSEEAVTIVKKSLAKMQTGGGVQDFLLAIMHTLAADMRRADICQKFVERIYTRKLDSFVQGVTCDQASTSSDVATLSKTVESNKASTSPATRRKDSSDGGSFGCSTIGGTVQETDISGFLIALSPLLLSIWSFLRRSQIL